MDLEKKERINGINGTNGHSQQNLIFNEKKVSVLEMLEVWLNTINHGLIAINTFYLCWYIYHEGFNEYQHFHAFFAFIGYQLFMSEGIMAMYNRNTYTMFIGSRKSKVWVHLALQVIGSGCVMFAIPYMFIKREQMKRDHLAHSHTIYGELLFFLDL